MVTLRQGDIIWLDFDPQSGFEQSGRRPAIVVSNGSFNRYSKMIMVCPITHTNKNHPFHVTFQGQSVTGVILCDQLKTLDISARNYKLIERAPQNIVFEVTDLINGFMEME